MKKGFYRLNLFILLLCFVSCNDVSKQNTIQNTIYESNLYSESSIESSINNVSSKESSISSNTEDSTNREQKIEDLTYKDYFGSEFKEYFRFIVASDVHIADSGSTHEEENLANLFKTAYDYSAEKEYKKVDGAFFTGDCSDNGSIESMKKFFNIVNSNAKDETRIRAVLGNHEFYTNAETTVDRFLEASDYEECDTHLVLGNLHFIFISPDESGNGFSHSKQEWLKSELEDAKKSDKTLKKPIFVFQHQHIINTVYGSECYGTEDLAEILSDYPQVIDFSGHSHFPLNDPKSIWQGDFTALGNGSLSYNEMGIVGQQSSSIYACDLEGGFLFNKAKTLPANQYYIVEIDDNYAVRIRGYDISTEVITCEYRIKEVRDKTKFAYSHDRGLNSEKPYFDDSAKIVLNSKENNIINLSIPQANCIDNVQHYRFELYNSNGKKIKQVFKLSDSFYYPSPTHIKATLTKVDSNSKYVVKCFAVSTWMKESEPLVLQIN